jgi:acetyl esterase
MKFHYRLPFKTRFLLRVMSLVRDAHEGMPTPKHLQQARRTLPKFLMPGLFFGRVPRGVQVENRMIPVRDTQIAVRIYRPQNASKLPLILNYHGGGWAVGNLQNNDYYCGILADRVGAVVVSVDYRLAPEHKFPTGLHDCYDALVWATAHAAELGADASRVCVTGDSAGGNLSAAVSLMSRDLGGPKIKLQALIYPATDARLQYASLETHAFAPILTKNDILNFLAMYMVTEADRLDPLLSPIMAESLAGLPQAIVVTAGYDPLCDDGQQYAARLQAEGVATEVLHYPQDIHGFFTLPNHSLSGKAAVEEVARRVKAAF